MRQQRGPLLGAEQVQIGQKVSGLAQRALQQPKVVGEHLVDERGTENVGVVFEFDEPSVRYHCQSQRNLRTVGTQLQLGCRDVV